jgi:Uncharacterized conserved protein
MHQDIATAVPREGQMTPTIALLTDFGLGSTFVGVMKGVILRIAPRAQLIDLTHAVPPQDIATGMWDLEFSHRYFPAGTVFVCVVDPGVGSERVPIALHAGDWYFVGPDNGLFSTILQRQTIHAAVALTNPEYQLARVSATFQGRDLFAPAGAYLAAGVPLREFGTFLDPQQLQRLAIEPPLVVGKNIQGQVIHKDQYGNLISNIPTSLLPAGELFFTQPGIRLFLPRRQEIIEQRRRYFAEQPARQQTHNEPFLYIDSTDYLAIAVQNGSAAATLGIDVGEPITLSLS